MTDVGALLAGFPVIPVVSVDEPGRAVAIAQALAAGGLPVIEITLRTPRALECLAAIARAMPQMLVGAGTVLSPSIMDEARAAGARFVVSPGSTPGLVDAAISAGHPWLPGSATLSEAMDLAERGFMSQKFFPAAAAGGVAFLKAAAPVVPQIRFCPTGGIHAGNAAEYLALGNVFAVGGSWLTPHASGGSADMASITALVRDALVLAQSASASAPRTDHKTAPGRG